MISIDKFSEVDLRVAVIKHAEPHPDADKLYVLKVDAGDENGDRQLVAGIKNFYSPEELVGKQIVMVYNLEPAIIRGVESHGMLLAAKDDDQLSVITTDKRVKPGSKIR